MGSKKGKKKSRKPKRQVTFTSKKGEEYDGTFESGKLKITEQRTARGQNLKVGTLNITTKEWNEEKRSHLPVKAKQYFEQIAFTH